MTVPPTRSHRAPGRDARAAAAALVALVALVAACGGGDPSADATPDTAAVAPAPAAPTPADARGDTTPADTAPFQGTMRPTVRESSGPVAMLTAVRTAERRAGFERVVFEFAGDVLPGHAVEYVDSARACGSGESVAVDGDAHLVVRLQPAQAHDESGGSTIAARTLRPGGGAVRELTVSCDFEATVTWVLGLDRRRPYRVLTLASPPRLVIDVSRE